MIKPGRSQIALFIGLGLMFDGAGNSAQAVAIKNSASDVVEIVVTENGVRTRLEIASLETITACSNGCFIELPDGQMKAFKGPESVEIGQDKSSQIDY